MACILGLDFGGTKLAAGLVDTATGVLVARASHPTPVAGGAEASLALMRSLAASLLADHGSPTRDQGTPGIRPSVYAADARSSLVIDPSSVVAVGVSFGGPVAADGRTVRLSMHVPGWEDVALADRLEAAFGVPAAVANDGDAAALAEYRFGAGRGVRHMLYLTVSTGIGGGVIIDGHLHRGERAWAGEVGHQVLKPDGPPCPCGRNGCLESLASGLSVARDARAPLAAPDAPPSALASIPPAELSARDVAAAAAQGDALAHEVWDAAMAWLGIGVASACNLLNPGRVVIGGGLTRAGDLLFAPVRRVAAERALDPALEIARAALGDDVGILGGAALVM